MAWIKVFMEAFGLGTFTERELREKLGWKIRDVLLCTYRLNVRVSS